MSTTSRPTTAPAESWAEAQALVLAEAAAEAEHVRTMAAQNAELAGIVDWLNTPGGASLSLAGLQTEGRVVLVDFWTYSCINCLRTLPYLTGWYTKYKDMGLEIVGIHTPEFEFENNQKYFEELRNFTSINYDFETRQKAFQYLNMIQACDAVCRDNLKQATKHHNWQFSKFAKEMLNQINN